MRRLTTFLVAILLSGTGGVVGTTTQAGAAANGWPRTAVTCVWITAVDMGRQCASVFANGDISPWDFVGVGHLMLAAPIVGATEVSGSASYNGWLVAADGGVFSYSWGRAYPPGFYGSMGGKHLNAPIVGIAASPSGYWLVARDGGIFSFGKARFYGSMGGSQLSAPIVGMAATVAGKGYWMVGHDGGVFTFGNARYRGSVPGRGLNVSDVVGITPTPSNKGYWIARADGHVSNFGDATRFGDYPITTDPVVAITSTRSIPGQGYCLVLRSGTRLPFGAHYAQYRGTDCS